MGPATGYKGPRPFRSNAPVTTNLTALTTEAKRTDYVSLLPESLIDGRIFGGQDGRINKRSSTMKRHSSIIHILSLACACLIFTGCAADQAGSSGGPAATSAGAKTGGHLIVNRIANFGSDLGLVILVDGAEVGTVPEGRTYNGYLTPGQHVLSATVSPLRAGSGQPQKTLAVQAGQTYSFTARWKGSKLALVRNQ